MRGHVFGILGNVYPKNNLEAFFEIRLSNEKTNIRNDKLCITKPVFNLLFFTPSLSGSIPESCLKTYGIDFLQKMSWKQMSRILKYCLYQYSIYPSKDFLNFLLLLMFNKLSYYVTVQ
ncbi:hypothetical protein BpHYR1_036955 [Brachionus plicatilis]|uniref:Uncharacterized protein n=1 Tax=Brachionus plicatilis TaxID=10195 RepID=A0A3M7S8Z3_BRAPC|nr:hypothetical protein BpHYR1_036955 [Brachionus plicatilis]